MIQLRTSVVTVPVLSMMLIVKIVVSLVLLKRNAFTRVAVTSQPIFLVNHGVTTQAL
eukprot:jgi/Orpsp1_1/1180140/evm.model.c7180000072280.1